MICEGAALGWGGIFLHQERHASLRMAAAAITAYTGGQTLGRVAATGSPAAGAAPCPASGAADHGTAASRPPP